MSVDNEARAVEKLKRAWNDAGPRPDIHEAAKRRLRQEWPTLHDAIVAVVEAPPASSRGTQ